MPKPISNFIPEPSDQNSMKTMKKATKTIGMSAVIYENNLYPLLDKACSNYAGGTFSWTEIEGCFYLICHDEETIVGISGNYIETKMPLSYAALCCNLMLTNMLCHHYYQKDDMLCEYWSNAYHRLRSHLLEAWDEGKGEESFLSDIFKLID
ncbi:hypothetical protein [Vibrio mediterranei]|uniref:hypothetical protein n=1 Tax=Vibrio mediterranei TaxID=689 RepID=UPI002285297E|nr:hypothetical protein [Vibrio mediterranei]MCY9855898.1 hypothetical protein [Vibrio mediterranei]